MPVSALKLPVDTPSAKAQSIAAFLRGYSIEATRLNASDVDAMRAVLPSGTPVFLTAVASRPHAALVEPAARLRAAGFEPVPHLAARQFASRNMLEEVLARLAARAAVRRVLAIAGDRPRAAGPFDSALELIESGLLQRHGIAQVGIAGYPEGHPRISQDALDRTLAAKIDVAEQTGLGVEIVAQFSFDAAAVAAWLVRLRQRGFDHPVRIGLAGPAGLATLLRYARRCGVRASAQGLTRRAGLVKHLLGTSAPDGVIRPLAEDRGRLGRVAAHFYSFGGVAATARWAAAAASGRIVLDRADGFGVEPHQ